MLNYFQVEVKDIIMARKLFLNRLAKIMGKAAPIVVLLIIGAVFSGKRFAPENTAAQSDSDQSGKEAIMYLTSIADAQIAYFVANNFWAGYPDNNGVFKSLGWKPDSSAHYAYYCGNDFILPKKNGNPYNFPDPNKNWPYGQYPEITLSDFVCMAIGNNDNDDYPDVWMIDKFKLPTHAIDDASNKVLVDIVSTPLDTKDIFVKMYEAQNPKATSRINIEINIPAYRLDLYEDGKRLKSYPIAIGMRKYKTPIRDFYIQQVEWNPWWIPPDAPWAKRTDPVTGEKIREKPKPPGPSNPLGPVKMSLQSAILLHGTNKPQSIGRAASHSCMRIHPDNAVDLAWKIIVLAGAKQPLFKKEIYRDKSRRTYQLSLLTYVQVTTTYRRMEVYDNSFLLHTDPYSCQPLKADAINAKLNEVGISPDMLGENKAELYSGKQKKTVFVPIKVQ